MLKRYINSTFQSIISSIKILGRKNNLMVENENLINDSIQTNLNIDEDQINVCNEITSIESIYYYKKIILDLIKS